MDSFSVKKVNSFTEIEKDWQDLLERASFKTIFQTYEWNETWWRYLKKNWGLYLVACYRGNKIAGLVPLMLDQMKIKGVPAFKILSFVGCPEADYHDFILDHQFADEAFIAIIDWLVFNKKQWSILRLPEFHEDSPTHGLIDKYLRCKNIHYAKFQHTTCPCIDLPSSFDDYMVSLGYETRKKTRKNNRRLEKIGELRFELGEPNDIGDFFKLNTERWQLLGQGGSVPTEELRNFHVEVSSKLRKYLNLSFLTLNKKRIAVQYSYDYCKVRCVYLQGMDMEYDYYSPGIIIMMNRIEDAICQGMKCYDLMRGDEAYKFHYAKHIKHNQLYYLCHSKYLLKIFLNIEKLAERSRTYGL